MKIFVIGSINTDLVINTPYIPQSGETVTGGGFFVAHGGKGANQAVAAARLGGTVIMSACVGNDSFGEEAVAALQAEGIDVSHIRFVDNVPTGTAMIIVSQGDNRIILDKGANAHLSQADIDGTLSEASAGDILLVQLESPIEVVGYAMKCAKEKGMYVVLNPAPADKSVSSYLDGCDLIIPNETECEILGGQESLARSVSQVIVTLGSKGFAYYDGKEFTEVSCIPVKAVDTTAAGDTFCGGLVVRLAEGDDLVDAAKFGSAAASLACTRKDAQPSIPTYSEVDKFIK